MKQARKNNTKRVRKEKERLEREISLYRWDRENLMIDNEDNKWNIYKWSEIEKKVDFRS
jgi:hypothetical protein